MTWKTLLVPHDFSASAEHATAIACDEAASRGARIVLLHVVELVPHFGPETAMMVRPGTSTPISVRRHFVELAEGELRPVAARLTAAGVATTALVRSGIPVDEIRQVVEDQGIDLIVMGTHGRTGLRRWIIGSVAERVIRSSVVPVLSIRHPDAQAA